MNQPSSDYTVAPFEAFNCLIAESVLILDCCATRRTLPKGAVVLESYLPEWEALKAAYELAPKGFGPDNASVAILFEDGQSEDTEGSSRGLQVARWLDAQCCTRVLRVEREAFLQRYGFLMDNEDELSYPSEIVEGSLFLGSVGAMDEQVLKDLRITHVVSVMDRYMQPPRGRAHLSSAVRDDPREDLTPVMEELLPYIEQALNSGGRVLVHSEHGQSRSASVVAAHLMRSHDMSLDKSLALLRRHRPRVRPNEGFMRQLQECLWEEIPPDEGPPRKRAMITTCGPLAVLAEDKHAAAGMPLLGAGLTAWLENLFVVDHRRPEHFPAKKQTEMGNWVCEDFNEGMIVKRELEGGLGVLLENVFTRRECQRIIAETEHIGYGYTSFPQAYRGNRRLQMDDVNGALAEKIWHRVQPYVPTQLDVDWMPEDGDYPNGSWEPVCCNKRFRFSKYFPGDRFEMHRDQLAFFHSSSCSFLTVNIYLNDIAPKQQGRTRFFMERGGAPIDVAGGTAGSLVIFRQEHALHDGDRLASGLKYLMRTDVVFQKKT